MKIHRWNVDDDGSLHSVEYSRSSSIPQFPPSATEEAIRRAASAGLPVSRDRVHLRDGSGSSYDENIAKRPRNTKSH